MSNAMSNSTRKPVLGCIADDVTGATDLAINLVQGGMCVVQVLDAAAVSDVKTVDADAIVVALKTRSIPKDDAIALSLEALDALQDVGVERFFFKYCSTFDSTERGNIGPVAESLLKALDARQTIFCPAFPRNGRTVYHGHLFVHGKPLHESGMANHPLNPMTDANLVRFLGKQTSRKIGLLNYDDLAAGDVASNLLSLIDDGCSFVVTDACDETHLQLLASAVSEELLVTGGSGIARYLPDAYRTSGLFESEPYVPSLPRNAGRGLVVAGSCSSRTLEQVAWMAKKCNAWQVDVEAVLADPGTVLERLMLWANAIDPSRAAMIYSSAKSEDVSKLQADHGRDVVAHAIETFLATATARMVDEMDVGKLVIAGGETSGAIVKGLGVRALRIGPEICAGVPWTESIGGRPLALALKSGNFGDEDFFERALEMLA